MGATEITRTAFDRVQRDLGCEFMDWEGWYWPSHFGDPVAEHHAVRNDVGVWDASPLRKWGFSGADALAAADRVFTNDMLGLEIGQVRYAPFCDENGKMVGDGTVFKLDEENCIVVTALDSDLDHFNTVVAGLDVEITPMTEATPQVGINGPRSRELLQSICEADVSSLRYFRFWPEHVNVGGVPCRVSRTGYSGELGFELFCSPDDAEQLWAAVVGCRRAALRPRRRGDDPDRVGVDLHRLRLLPARDEPVRHVARQADPPRRPDFTGKAALAAEAGDPPRRLVTLVLEGGDVPEYGAAVTKDGAPVGTLTSPCESPTLGKVIGMAVLDSSCCSDR